MLTDSESPIFSGCPGVLNVNTDPGNATAVVTWKLPLATDNSGSQNLTSTDNPGDSFPIGNHTVTYTSADAAGNTAVCTFYVVVTGKCRATLTYLPSIFLGYEAAMINI